MLLGMSGATFASRNRLNVPCDSWINGQGIIVGARCDRDHHTRGRGTGRRCAHMGHWPVEGPGRELSRLGFADHSELHSLDLRKVTPLPLVLPISSTKASLRDSICDGVAKILLRAHAAEACTRVCNLFCIESAAIVSAAGSRVGRLQRSRPIRQGSIHTLLAAVKCTTICWTLCTVDSSHDSPPFRCLPACAFLPPTHGRVKFAPATYNLRLL
jgi:hypothetical protein